MKIVMKSRLEKAKYIKRTGSKGNYKYYYKEPVGRTKKQDTKKKEKPNIEDYYSEKRLSFLNQAYGWGEKLKDKYPDLTYRQATSKDEEADYYGDGSILDHEWLAVGSTASSRAFLKAGFIGSKPVFTIGWRYGVAPENGQSKNFRDDYLEDGVSFMETENSGKVENTTHEMFTESATEKNKKWYVGFEIASKGADGEPLLVNVKPLNMNKSINLEGKGDNYSLEKLSKKHKESIDKINKEYAMGIKVELEHTKDPAVASQIVLDHLTESPEYYSKLSEMESTFEKSISDTDKKKVDNFFKNYKGKMKDDDLHEFAESLGLSPHDVEEYIYEIAKEHTQMNKSKIMIKSKYLRRTGSPGNYKYIYKEGVEPASIKDVPELVPPGKFDAEAYFNKTNDPNATIESVMQGASQEIKDKIAETEKALKDVTPTIEKFRKSGEGAAAVYSPEREALHAEIISKMFTPEKIKGATPVGQPELTILGGRGGSGKSWFNGKVYDPDKSIVLDSDEIKGQLPEYEGWNAFEVHEESSDILEKAEAMAKSYGLNIVIDATMKSTNKAVARVQNYKELGYDIKAHYMHCPRQISAQRSVKRFGGASGRYVPVGVVLSNTSNEKTFDSLKPLASSWSFLDSSGTPPPNLISKKNGIKINALAKAIDIESPREKSNPDPYDMYDFGNVTKEKDYSPSLKKMIEENRPNKSKIGIKKKDKNIVKSIIDYSDRLRRQYIRKYGSYEENKQLESEEKKRNDRRGSCLMENGSKPINKRVGIKKNNSKEDDKTTSRGMNNIGKPQAEYDRKYKLEGRVNWNGLNIAIENKKGSYRSGTDINGKPWKTLMSYDYGRIGGSKATDNEGVDIYLGEDDTSDMVYVVHQVDPFNDYKYDEDKAMCGFPSRESAITAYQSQYNRPDFLGEVSEFTIPEFKQSLIDNRGRMLYKSPNIIKSKDDKKDLAYWKKKLLGIINMNTSMKKSIMMQKGRGYPVGQIREWSGRKYKKVSPTKWMPVHESMDTRGAKQSVRIVSKKIQNAQSMEDLVKIVQENKARFRDPDGKVLPIVKEFLDIARTTEPGKKDKKVEVLTKKGNPAISKIASEFDLSVEKVNDLVSDYKKEFPKRKVNIDTVYKLVSKHFDKEAEGLKTEIDKLKNPGLRKIHDKYQKEKKISGDTDDIYIGKDELSGTWKLVEVDAPQASHNEKSFNKTEGFPTNEDGSTINDRDYEKDKAAQESVVNMASSFDGRALHFDSPVVVTQDGVVISGNNRTMSSKLAASKGTDKKYIEVLNKRAKKFGFSPEDIAKFKNPRVVFEVSNDQAYSTKQFAQFNEVTTKTMSPVEAAVKVSKTMTQKTIDEVSEVISDFDTMGEVYSNKKAVNEIFNNLQKGNIINEFNRPQYVTDSGITGAGKEFLETVMIGSVVNEANIRGLSRDGYKNIRKKLVRAITGLVQNKGMADYAITDEINQAIDVMMQVTGQKEKFANVEDFAKQGTMFEKNNPVAIELAKKLEGTEKEFTSFMNKMNASLSVGADGQADLFFGGVESKEDILSRMLNLKKALSNVIKKTRLMIRR